MMPSELLKLFLKNMNVLARPSAFWAIDFDRCIGNVDQLYGLLEAVVNEVTPLDVARLEAARQEMEASGGSFNMLGYLRHVTKIDQATYGRVAQSFLERARGMRHQLLEPGAEELFQYLETRAIPYAIISYGNPDWQRLKIRAAGCGEVPTHITSYPEKGILITDWHDELGGHFVVPASIVGSRTDLLVDEVVLVDDKARAFHGLPADARGYWVHSLSGELLPSQQGSVPEQVTTVRGLPSLIQAEQLHNM